MSTPMLRRCGSVGKDVLLRPAGEIQGGAGRQEVEARSGQRVPTLAGQHAVEALAQGMEMEHVPGGVAALGLAQARRTPVRALLALVEIDPEQLAAQVLEAVPVGVG